MKTTDLRINNYYQAKSPGKTQWQTNYKLCNFGMQQALNNEINLKGILLTEKWLIDFGMEMPINEDPIFEYGKGKYKNCFNDFKKTSQSLIDASFEINGLNFWADSNGFWFNIMMDYTKIEYVHEFQNLYYALTANELKREEKIKEKAKQAQF